MGVEFHLFEGNRQYRFGNDKKFPTRRITVRISCTDKMIFIESDKSFDSDVLLLIEFDLLDMYKIFVNNIESILQRRP